MFACVSLPLALSWWAIALGPVDSRVVLSLEQHELEREQLVQQERSLEVGGQILLSSAEQFANSILMEAKYREVDLGFQNVSQFNPASHFFLRKKCIEASPVFDFIRRMPKGAALHVHDTALIGSSYLVKNITYRDNLYICIQDDRIQLLFSASAPQSDNCVYQLLKDVRKSFEDPEEFDAILEKTFSLVTDDPVNEYSDINDVWSKFGKIFGTITPMLTYKPVWEDYFYEALRQYREDNILYMEFRTTLPELYDLEGNKYNSVECANIYKQVNDRFIRDYPDTLGSRLIYAPSRSVSPSKVQEYIEIAKEIRNQLGDYVAGFDLVGQEDLGKPLKEFIAELVTLPGEINVYYHAGETNWYGTATDYNLIDAVLLGAKRLGHAYAILKHPVMSKIVKEEGIAIEVNPISNQVLMLVEDMRNHPASVMLAENYPVVISSDDPGLWGALPLSHDLYETFVGLASRHSDIRLLKQLALNSIRYSSMPVYEKNDAINRFTEQWDNFIQTTIKSPAVLKF